MVVLGGFKRLDSRFPVAVVNLHPFCLSHSSSRCLVFLQTRSSAAFLESHAPGSSRLDSTRLKSTQPSVTLPRP